MQIQTGLRAGSADYKPNDTNYNMQLEHDAEQEPGSRLRGCTGSEGSTVTVVTYAAFQLEFILSQKKTS